MKKPLDVIAGLFPTLPNTRHFDLRRTVAALIIAGALSACSSPAVRVQYIETKTYIPYPTSLVAPVSVVLPLGVTWGNALDDTRAGLDTCNGQLKAIKGLVPPI